MRPLDSQAVCLSVSKFISACAKQSVNEYYQSVNESISKLVNESACLYRVILKKVSFGIFLIILVYNKEKKIYCKMQRQRAITEQVFMIFGHGQNHQNGHLQGHISQRHHDGKIIFMQK